MPINIKHLRKKSTHFSVSVCYKFFFQPYVRNFFVSICDTFSVVCDKSFFLVVHNNFFLLVACDKSFMLVVYNRYSVTVWNWDELDIFSIIHCLCTVFQCALLCRQIFCWFETNIINAVYQAFIFMSGSTAG